MGFFEFPFTRTYSDDLGWLIRQVKFLTDQINIKTINYADPIYWDITHQYPKYTVVIDPVSNTAYLSTQPVPQNIAITDTDYWQPVFDFTTLFAYAIALREQLAIGYETTNIADNAYSVGELVFVKVSNEDLLYQVVAPISIGDNLVNDPLDPGYNIKKVTFEELLGNLLTLDTSTQTSLVDAINEVFHIADDAATDLGDISNLNTTDTTSAVNAINEVNTGMLANTAAIARKKNVLIVGDSYCVPGYVTPGLEWYNLLKTRDEYKIYNYAIGGAGFAAHQTGSKYITDLIDDAYAGISDPDSIGFIIMYAGLNDYNLNVTDQAVYTAMKTAIAYAQSKFTKADILFVPFDFPYSAMAKYQHMRWLAACVDAGHESGVLTYEFGPFIFSEGLVGTYVDGSGHPNADGNELIYDVMRKMLLGNNRPKTIRRAFEPTTYNGVTLCAATRGWFELEGIQFKGYIGFLINADTYTAGTYRCASLRKDGRQNSGSMPVGFSRDLIYDNQGLNYSTYNLTFHTNTQDGSIAATFANNQTFGGISQGYYRYEGNIIDNNPT